MTRLLAVIPARGGSRRLPGKNIRPFLGRPLIAWTIDAAMHAASVDRVIVTTDDDEIAAVAREAGAEVPFLRPAHLADDVVAGDEAVIHALRWAREAGITSSHCVALQPTSPLRTAADVDAAAALLVDKQADAVVSVCPSECPPAWVNTLPPDASMTAFYRDGVRLVRSQDHEPTYRLTGAIEIVDIERALRQGHLEMDDAAYAYVMPRDRSADIDDEVDFVVAEALGRHRAEGIR